MTSTVNYETTSIFYNTVQNVERFTAVFDYTDASGAGTGPGTVANGLCFVIQNAGPTALGGQGGGMGYGNTDGDAHPPIQPSVAFTFRIYDGTAGKPVGIAYTTNGALPLCDPTAPVNIRSANPIRATVTYDWPTATLSLNLRDTVTNDTFDRSWTSVSIPAVVGGSTAYVGFAGGTGGATADQYVGNFSYTANPLPTYTWDGSTGLWASGHWGAGSNYPDAFKHAVIPNTNTGVVTVNDNNAALSLAADSQASSGAGLVIAAARSLTVAGPMTATANIPVTLGAGAALTAGSGSIASLQSSGNATVGATSATGLLAVGTLNNQGILGTFIKNGAGTLVTDNANGTGVAATGTTFQVDAGTMTFRGANPFGGATSVTLNGGTVTLLSSATAGGTANQLTEKYYYAGGADFGPGHLSPSLDSGSGLLTLTPFSTGTLTEPLNFPSDSAATFQTRGGLPDVFHFGAVWQGAMTIGGSSPLAPGLYSFAMVNNDGAALYIDGQQVVANLGTGTKPPAVARSTLGPAAMTSRWASTSSPARRPCRCNSARAPGGASTPRG